MSEVTEFDLAGYSQAIARVVEGAGPHVAAVKSAAYRVASGVIFRQDLIAVNNHLLKREGKIPVHLHGGEEVEANILGRAVSLDLAVLQVPGAKLAAAEPETEAGLRAGALAVVVGRTLDAGLSASVGILGAVGGPRRTWRGGAVGELQHFLRLDVNLYPSQAGAAVVSAHGRVFGMATPAILRHSALAIPMGTLHSIADKMLNGETDARQGYLGVGLQPVAIPEHLRSKMPLSGETGLMIVSIETGSSAEKAGLQLGDILAVADDTPLTHAEALLFQLRAKQIRFTVVRAGQIVEQEIEVAPRPERRS